MAHPIQDQVGTDFTAFTEADAAVARIGEIYDASTAILREAFQARGEAGDASAAVYPYLAIEVDSAALPADTRLPYGVLLEPGFYGTTLSRPDLFTAYLTE